MSRSGKHMAAMLENALLNLYKLVYTRVLCSAFLLFISVPLKNSKMTYFCNSLKGFF